MSDIGELWEGIHGIMGRLDSIQEQLDRIERVQDGRCACGELYVDCSSVLRTRSAQH